MVHFFCRLLYSFVILAELFCFVLFGSILCIGLVVLAVFAWVTENAQSKEYTPFSEIMRDMWQYSWQD